MRDFQNPDSELIDLNVTHHAKEMVQKVIRDPYFRDQDPELILSALQNELHLASFGIYLKRILNRVRLRLDEKEREPDDLGLICHLFDKYEVPPAFEPTTARLRNLARNWLTQQTVNRNVVLILGFGLKLQLDEVQELLSKGLREPRLSPKDPFEVICWFCYKNALPYAFMQKTWQEFAGDGTASSGSMHLDLLSTVSVRRKMEQISSLEELSAYLSTIPMADGSFRQSVSARTQFDILYQKAKEIAAETMTEMARDAADKRAIRQRALFDQSDRLYDYEKKERVERARNDYRVLPSEEVTAADLESILYAAVPKDKNGNLLPMKASALNGQFAGKRLNRQRMTEILMGKAPITRYDLLTLCFYVSAQDEGLQLPAKKRYIRFVNEASRVLRESDMDPLYLGNPYEDFLLMCILCDDPLGTFADVWELSYQSVP